MNNIFTILFNLYLLISIPVYWDFYRWSILQGNYFIFGVLSLFIISNFMLSKKRDFKNTWLGSGLLISLTYIFIHNYYISEFTKKFASFSLMSEGFLYLLCGCIFLKLIYEYGEKDLRKYPFLWIALLIFMVRAFIEKSFSPICAVLVSVVLYFYARKNYTAVYFIFLPIIIGIVKFYNEIWLNLQPRIWNTVIMAKDIINYPLGKGFNNSLNGEMIQCDMFEKWGHKWGAVSATNQAGLVYPHNDYLNIMVNFGIFALVILIGLIISLFKDVKLDLLAFGCIAVLITAFVQTTFYFPKNAVLFIPLFSILSARSKSSKFVTR